MNDIKIQDVLHYYLGCEVLCINPFFNNERKFNKKGLLIQIAENEVKVRHNNNDIMTYHKKEVKPLLRSLDSMTEEEMKKCGNLVYDFSDDPYLNIWEWKNFEIGLAPEQFHWLLSKGFDLFGLLEKGLAIKKEG